MRFKVKIIYDTDESQYIVFIDGIRGIEGYGDTEQEAINDFTNRYELLVNKS